MYTCWTLWSPSLTTLLSFGSGCVHGKNKQMFQRKWMIPTETWSLCLCPLTDSGEWEALLYLQAQYSTTKRAGHPCWWRFGAAISDCDGRSNDGEDGKDLLLASRHLLILDLSLGIDFPKLPLSTGFTWIQKAKWLWLQGTSGSRCLALVILDRISLPQTNPVQNLGVLLDLQVLLKGQVAVVVRRAFVQLHAVCQLCPYLTHETLCIYPSHLYPNYLLAWFLQHILHGAPLEKYLKAAAGAELSGLHNPVCS